MPNEQVVDGFRRYRLDHRAAIARLLVKNYSMEKSEKSAWWVCRLNARVCPMAGKLICDLD